MQGFPSYSLALKASNTLLSNGSVTSCRRKLRTRLSVYVFLTLGAVRMLWFCCNRFPQWVKQSCAALHCTFLKLRCSERAVCLCPGILKRESTGNLSLHQRCRSYSLLAPNGFHVCLLAALQGLVFYLSNYFLETGTPKYVSCTRMLPEALFTDLKSGGLGYLERCHIVRFLVPKRSNPSCCF